MKMRFAALLLSTAFFANSVLAGTNNDGVNKKVMSTFLLKFNTAKQVSWDKTSNFSKATFRLNDTYMFAYFTDNGDLIGMSRNLVLNQLPINLQTELKKTLSGSWLVELFEFSTEHETVYYATLENADHTMMFKSADNLTWLNYKTIKKKS